MNVIDRINARYERENNLRTDLAILPYQKDRALGETAPWSTCDNCGEPSKCKIYPIPNGNALLCYRCFVKEQNFLRMNYASEQTTSWSTMKWYGVVYPREVEMRQLYLVYNGIDPEGQRLWLTESEVAVYRRNGYRVTLVEE